MTKTKQHTEDKPMNKKILIIEDDENITCLEKDYLEAHGLKEI